ncbi:MAG: hypothetical protein RLY35_977 [Bacteroidota bacterium]|jgi:hypothetical protein
MNYNKLNVILGWAMFVVATVVYTLTLEPTMPFWDCGEFIASAYKLEVGHPPGAPLFMMIARLFSAFVDPAQVPFMVNFLSAVSSGATIMFLFWSITHLAKKMAGHDAESDSGKMWAVLGSGIIGGLAYTFSDTFWFSAVEGEVYAMSSLFTAVVFWAILKWESMVTKDNNELRWVILIAYLMGLSIGVHLLNLLAIPAICFVYYFKKYDISIKGMIYTLLVSLGLLTLMQTGIIIYFVKAAAATEKLFVNGFGLGFNSGVIFYLLLVTALIVLGLRYFKKKNMLALHTLVLGITVAIIGYTTFAVILVRSQANTPMDENNPENMFALLSYLNREQYGDRPLLFGQYFNTPEDVMKPYSDGGEVWIPSFSVRDAKGKLVQSCREKYQAEEYIAANKDQKLSVVQEYIETGEKKNSKVNYRKEFSGFLPRMHSNQPNHIQEYKKWSNYHDWNTESGEEKIRRKEQQIAQMEAQLNQAKSKQELNMMMRSLDRLYDDMKPTASEDYRFMMDYQINFMYWRYFMWNFAGRQDDNQGSGDFLDGNWMSGISMVDEARLGNMEKLPEMEKNNKARNFYYFLPFILGLFGLIYQLIKNYKDFIVVGLLFALTGFAILIYLNQTPLQPRERDYAYAGSFYAFAIWIGLGVYALYYFATQLTQQSLAKIFTYAGGTAAVFYVLEIFTGSGHGLSYSLISMLVIGGIWMGLAWMLQKIGLSAMMKSMVIIALTLPVPYLMAKEGWDDHNRAGRETGLAMAINYLQSLAPNAIVFTNGDNDTFPLWYAQEVEGIRTDVRVVNMSLLNTDWYIDQQKRRAYESAPVPFSMNEQKYRQGTRDVVYIQTDEEKPGYMSLNQAMKFVQSDDKKDMLDFGSRFVNYFPNHRFYINVDSTKAEQFRGMMNEGDSLVKTIAFQITDERGRPRRYLTKSQMMILDLLNNMDWDRPVYFAVTTGSDTYMGLEQYFQLEGLAYRFTPILHKRATNPYVDGGVNSDIMYNNMMTKFQWGNMDKGDIYLDENNRRMTANLRLQFSHLAEQLIDEGKKDKAAEVLDKCMSVIPDQLAPFEQPQILWRLTELYFDAGKKEKGLELSEKLVQLNQQEIDFFQSLDKDKQAVMERDMQMRMQVNDRMIEKILQVDPNNAKAKEWKANQENLLKELGFEVEDRRPRPVQKPKAIQDTTKPQVPGGGAAPQSDTVKF